DRSDHDRFRYSAAARQHYLAADVAWPCAELLRRVDGFYQRILGCRGGLPVALVRLLAVQAGNRQGRHGPWRLQAVGGTGCLARLAVAAGDHFDFVAGWRNCRHRFDGVSEAWAGGASSFRALSCRGRGGLCVVWWGDSKVVVWVCWSLMARNPDGDGRVI